MKRAKVQVLEIERFDLTPMIDIVLLLIIFFTFTATFAAVSRVPMDLPEERGAAGDAPATALFIDLARDGAIKLGEATVGRDELAAALGRELGHAGTIPEVIVRADRLTPAAHLNRLAGALAAAGAQRWKLATSGDGPPSVGTGGTP